jgi:hypothetical protein
MRDQPPRKRKVPIRWITLAEAVAIGAVLISGLGLYNSWSDRRDAAAPVAATKTEPLVLRATADKEGVRLSLAAVRDAQVIQSQTIAFPTALGVAAVETTGDPRVEADWVADALKRLGGKAGAGDRRLPVLLTTTYVEDGAERSDTALYNLGYAIEEGGLFGGSHVRLRGLSLVTRGSGATKARLDASWKPVAAK